MRFWSGDTIKELKENQIFVFGSNPSGIHGAGAAKAAVEFGAKYGVGRGLQGQTYALITKNLKAGYHEKATGITYATEGYKSLSAEQISENVKELYQCAKQHPDKFFIMAYKNETWPNGSSKKSLNGYTSEEMFELFMNNGDVPDNVILHNSFKPLAKNYLEQQNKSTNEKGVVMSEAKNNDIEEFKKLVTFLNNAKKLDEIDQDVFDSLDNIEKKGSAYHVDSYLGLDPAHGLSMKTNINSLMTISHVVSTPTINGYIAVAFDGTANAIVVDKKTNKAELVLSTDNTGNFHDFVDKKFPDNTEDVYNVMDKHKMDAVFKVRTGYNSPIDLIHERLPETKNIEGFKEAFTEIFYERSALIQATGLAFSSPDQEMLVKTAALQNVFMKLSDEELFSPEERFAIADNFKFKNHRMDNNMEKMFKLDPNISMKLNITDMDMMIIPPLDVSLYRTDEGDLYLADRTGFIKHYKEGEDVPELDGIPNDEYLFQVAEMPYIDECTKTYKERFEEEPEVEVESPVAKKKTTHKPR